MEAYNYTRISLATLKKQRRHAGDLQCSPSRSSLRSLVCQEVTSQIQTNNKSSTVSRGPRRFTAGNSSWHRKVTEPRKDRSPQQNSWRSSPSTGSTRSVARSVALCSISNNPYCVPISPTTYNVKHTYPSHSLALFPTLPTSHPQPTSASRTARRGHTQHD